MARRSSIQWFIKASPRPVHIRKCVNIHIYKIRQRQFTALGR